MVVNQYRLYKELQDRKREYIEYRGGSVDSQGNLLYAKEEVQTWVDGFDEAMAVVKKYM